jgi:hypothetical protein
MVVLVVLTATVAFCHSRTKQGNLSLGHCAGICHDRTNLPEHSRVSVFGRLGIVRPVPMASRIKSDQDSSLEVTERFLTVRQS